jgi:Fe-S-cluster containining protein
MEPVMKSVNLRSFRQLVAKNKKKMRAFLTRLEKNPPRNLDRLTVEVDREVWAETDCLTCANCCKKMTPTFNNEDVRRIAAHLGTTPAAFREKWLYKDRNGDWMNTANPCQFLDTKTNMCGIYEVRPKDCAGFPHLTRKKMTDYMQWHRQNVEYCPATYKMVEKIMERVGPLPR